MRFLSENVLKVPHVCSWLTADKSTTPSVAHFRTFWQQEEWEEHQTLKSQTFSLCRGYIWVETSTQETWSGSVSSTLCEPSKCWTEVSASSSSSSRHLSHLKEKTQTMSPNHLVTSSNSTTSATFKPFPPATFGGTLVGLPEGSGTCVCVKLLIYIGATRTTAWTLVHNNQRGSDGGHWSTLMWIVQQL